MGYPKRHWLTWLLAAAGAVTSGCGPGDDTPDWIHGWKLAETEDVRAQLQPPLPGEMGAGVTVAFEKRTGERRSLTLQALPGRKPEVVRSVEVRYRLTLTGGPPPRLAVVALEADGGAYFNVAPTPLETNEYAKEQIAFVCPRPAAFSRDADGRFQWDQVDRLWVGLVMDAPTAGRFKIYGADLHSEPWRPRRSLPVHTGSEGAWDLGKDPAVEASLTTPTEPAPARATMKLDFRLPGRRHMYVLATTPSPPGDLGPYHGLELKAKGRLPKGNVRMLVSLTEADGAQYYFEPALPTGEEWTTMTIPFSAFKPAGWAPDKDGQLDLNRVLRITVGAHGTTSEGLGKGWLAVKDLVYVIESEAGPSCPAFQPPKPEPTTKPATKPAKAPAATQPARAEVTPLRKPSATRPSKGGPAEK